MHLVDETSCLWRALTKAQPNTGEWSFTVKLFAFMTWGNAQQGGVFGKQGSLTLPGLRSGRLLTANRR